MNLLLSALALLTAVGTMTVTTRNLSESVSSETRNVEIISYRTTMQLIARLGGYLISNNIVLCKETSWSGHSNRKCRWTPRVPSGFVGGHAQFYGFSDDSTDDKLIYKVNAENLPFNLSEIEDKHDDVYYKITFDLVPYRSYQNVLRLVGETAPTCRSSVAPFGVIDGVCNNPEDTVITCKDKDDLTARVSNSVCHYDKDDMFVLIEVSYYNAANDELQDKIFAGLKRPSTHTVLALNTDISALCQWACSSNTATTEFMSCRGKWVYDSTAYDTDVFPTITVINKGPGAIYKLSLLKETATGSDTDIFSLQNPVREVLLPGETLEFIHPNGNNLCKLAALTNNGTSGIVDPSSDNICPSGYVGVEHVMYVEPARLYYPLTLMHGNNISPYDNNNNVNSNINMMDISLHRAHFTINPTRDFIKVMQPDIKMGKNSKKFCFPSSI